MSDHVGYVNITGRNSLRQRGMKNAAVSTSHSTSPKNQPEKTASTDPNTCRTKYRLTHSKKSSMQDFGNQEKCLQCASI